MERKASTLFSEKLLSQRGFTLVEIMIVTAIIVIIAAVALPNLYRAIEYSRLTEMGKWTKTMADAAETYSSITGQYPQDLNSLTTATPPYVNATEALQYCGPGPYDGTPNTYKGYDIVCVFYTENFMGTMTAMYFFEATKTYPDGKISQAFRALGYDPVTQEYATVEDENLIRFFHNPGP